MTRLGPVRLVPLRDLDSLAAAAAAEAGAAGAAWAGATEETADSLWLLGRALERRAALYRSATAAARRSAAGAAARTPGGIAEDRSGLVRVCRAGVRIRWGGPLVGPEPVDREHVVRLVAAPGGRWIVFSSFLRRDDPPEFDRAGRW